MSSSEVTNHELLAGAAYGDDRHLAARQALYHWQTPRYDLPAIVVRELADTTGLVIDLGCGNGKFIRKLHTERPDLRTIGLDISAGILRDVEPPVVVADAQHLPFGDEIADAILAMHMLYHVEDIDAGIGEIRRLLRRDGIAIASTNSQRDKVELEQLWSRAAADILGIEQGPRRISLSSRFCLEAAPRMLRRHFAHVRTLELPGVIVLTDPEPIIAHLGSYEAWAAQMAVPFGDTLARAREIATREIHEHGSFRISCLGGILVCHGHPAT